MRAKIGRWLADRLQVLLERTQPRVIMDRDGSKPYLSRYYLFGKPTMPDGSDPFDQFGNPKPAAVWKDGWGLYIHRFHESDAAGALHSHPFSKMFSFVIAGGYLEERRVGDHVEERVVKPLGFNRLTDADYHRVVLIEKDAWTLFLVGPKSAGWGFWEPKTGRVTPWRQFLKEQREAAQKEMS